MKRVSYQPADMPRTSGYVPVVAVTGGRTIYVSGQVALDVSGNVVGVGDVRAQTTQAFHNLGAALTAAGAGFADLVKLSFFVCDFADFPLVREVREEFLDGDARPTSTAVGVASLFRPELLVEIDAVAVVPGDAM